MFERDCTINKSKKESVVTLSNQTTASTRAQSTHGLPMKVIAVSVCLAITGCATKGETGALVGAALGAVVGKAIGGRDGALLGAALGAVIGGGIGANMDAADKVRLAQARAAAASSAARQEFYSQSAKVTVVVQPGESNLQPKSKVVLASDVVERGLTEVAEQTVTAYVDTPVYAAPTFDTAPKLVVPAGANITTVAAVHGVDDWVLVGSSGYGIGYVHRKMLDAQVRADVESVLRTQVAVVPTVTSGAVAEAPAPAPSVTAREATKRATAKPIAKAPAKPAVKSPPSKAADTAVVTAAAPATSNVANTTESLLVPGVSYLPPKSHLQSTASNAADYTKSLDVGREKAKAVTVSGKSTAELRLVAVSVECKDLTSMLLSNSREMAREKTTACKGQDGTWRV